MNRMCGTLKALLALAALAALAMLFGPGILLGEGQDGQDEGRGLGSFEDRMKEFHDLQGKVNYAAYPWIVRTGNTEREQACVPTVLALLEDVRRFSEEEAGDLADECLLFIAETFRRLERFDQALALYRETQERFPDATLARGWTEKTPAELEHERTWYRNLPKLSPETQALWEELSRGLDEPAARTARFREARCLEQMGLLEEANGVVCELLDSCPPPPARGAFSEGYPSPEEVRDDPVLRSAFRWRRLHGNLARVACDVRLGILKRLGASREARLSEARSLVARGFMNPLLLRRIEEEPIREEEARLERERIERESMKRDGE